MTVSTGVRLAVVVVLVGILLAPTAAAQDMQLQLSSPGFGETPESLPAVYEAPVTVEIRSPAGMPCLCEETHITFVVPDLPGLEGTFEPPSFTIDWPSHYVANTSPSAQATLATTLTVQVPEAYLGQEATRITVDAQAENRGGSEMVQGFQTMPLELALTFPPAPPEELNTTDAGDEQSERSVPGPGALVALAVAGLAAGALARAQPRR